MRSKPSWPHDEILHAFWVQRGGLLAGEYPSSIDPDKRAEKLRVLIEAGVDSIVDLTEVGEKARGGKTLEPYRELLSHEAAALGKSVPKYKRFPIPDNSIIDDDGYDDIIKYIRSEMDAGRVVYVHCWGGKGRTCTVIGCWLIDNEGLDHPATLRRIRELRRGTKKAHDPVPDTEAQRDVLRDRAARRNRDRTP